MLLSLSVLLPFYILERPSKCPGRLLACHLSNITLSLLPHMGTVRFMIAITESEHNCGNVVGSLPRNSIWIRILSITTFRFVCYSRSYPPPCSHSPLPSSLRCATSFCASNISFCWSITLFIISCSAFTSSFVAVPCSDAASVQCCPTYLSASRSHPATSQDSAQSRCVHSFPLW